MSETHIIYNPDGLYQDSPALAPEQSHLCFTPWIANLFWLVEPRIDTEGIEAGRGNPLLLSIRDFMDDDTQYNLSRLPLQFMEFFKEFNKEDDLAMTEKWPAAYMQTMLRRAKEAQRRLLGIQCYGNVIRVNFGRRAA